jgi:hypothetical protein
MNYLPLQVCKIDVVVINNTKRTNAGSGQVQSGWGAEAPGSDN